MATFTVTTTADVVNANDGVLSLREAVTKANATAAADKIVFAANVEGNTLTLTQGALSLTTDITIDGNQNNDATRVTLNGAGTTQHFRIGAVDADVQLTDMVLSNGSGRAGESIELQAGHLGVTNCDFSSNTAQDLGGSIIVLGSATLAVDGSSFAYGTAANGGAIFVADGASVAVRSSEFQDNLAMQSGGAIFSTGDLTIADSLVLGNTADKFGGGGIVSYYGSLLVQRSTIASNTAYLASGGGILAYQGPVTIEDSTIAHNQATQSVNSIGGGIGVFSGSLVLRGSTVTDNIMNGSDGGGIGLSSSTLDIANSIVVGNRAAPGGAQDVLGAIALSDGHNLFGSTVMGAVSGDRQNVIGSSIFPTTNASTGGGILDATHTVPLLLVATNPALGGGEPFTAFLVDQHGTARPLPAGTLPDLGAVESNFALSTTPSANNDLLTGTGAANTISGKAGADYIKGLGGADTLNGGDLLDGGTGNDKLNGGNGIDIVTYASGTTAVVVDLSGTTDTAKRGSETDTLTSIEGAIGSAKADTFKGDANANWFMGGLGKDTFTGGGGHDFFDFNSTADSGVGAGNRDIIKDFAPGTDHIDLMGIDADANIAGNQAFHFVGTAALTGPAQVGYEISGGNTIVHASTDGDAAAEIEIQLTGIKALTATDFYL